MKRLCCYCISGGCCGHVVEKQGAGVSPTPFHLSFYPNTHTPIHSYAPFTVPKSSDDDTAAPGALLLPSPSNPSFSSSPAAPVVAMSLAEGTSEGCRTRELLWLLCVF